jgi:uncharacterized phage protein (TIGR02220 family)
MRDYGKVHTSFWTSSTVREMSEDGRTLAFYLLSCPHGTIAGVARIPDGYACEDLKWSAERVRAAFIELDAHAFARRCEATAWVWIQNYLEWNPLENPNQRKAARKVADQVPPTCVWVKDFNSSCGPLFELNPAPLPNPSGTVTGTLSKPFRNQEQEQEQESIVSGGAEDPAPPRQPKAQTFKQEASAVLDHLNEQAGRNYKAVQSNLTLIAARLREGFTVDECKAVIDLKAGEWRGDAKMDSFLRPKTIFNAANFASYAGALSNGSGRAEGKGWK